MDDFDNGPYAFSAGYPPYETYADTERDRPESQHPGSWQPDYPHYPPHPPRPPAGGWSVPPGVQAPPPRRGSGPQPVYRRDSGPQPAYQRDGGPQAAYQRRGGPPEDYRDTGPRPGVRPGSGPNPVYRRDTGPSPVYRRDSGPMAAGPSRSGPRHRPADSMLLAGPPPARGPRPAGQGPGSQATGEQAALGSLLSVGKRVPGWLPYGSRLVLLPPDLALDEPEADLREHRDVNGGWLRPAVFGAMDGLVTNSSLIAGIGGGGGGAGMIVLTGIAGLIAGAFSMATGEYISVKSQNELTAAEVELERRQHARDPAGKLTRLTQLFIDKGVSPNLAEAVVRQISADPDRAVATHVREELGIDPDDLPSPQTAAVASLASFTVGALIPLAPFLIGVPSLTAALVLAGGAAFAGGAAVARLAGRSPWRGGLRQLGAAFLATVMSFGIGHVIGTHLS